VVTIQDMVNAQKLLVDNLGIKQLFAVAGGSMGGMQALQWAVSYPDMVRRAVVVASTAFSTPQQIAFNAVGRRAIVSDPAWDDGDYYGKEPPSRGLSLARMVGHITYLSEDAMHSKFGRRLQGKDRVGFDFTTDFQVESYLYYNGDKFIERFDPNSYLYVTKAIDYFDLTVDGSLIAGLVGVKAKMLVVGVSSDWLYPLHQSQEIVSALAANGLEARYCEIRSPYGHDAFLVEDGQLNYLLKGFLNHITSGDVMSPARPISEGTTIEAAAEMMIAQEVDHLPVVDTLDRLSGIVTSWDIARAVARRMTELGGITTRAVVTTTPGERIEEVLRKMEDHRITSLPVVDADHRVLGMVSHEGLSALMGRCRG
jgi:homoserine O-acetyltransferase